MGDLWGVGRRQVERLAVLGIRTGWDLAQADPKRIPRQFSVTLERTALELRGISCIESKDFHEPRQRIMTSRSFGKLTDNLGEIRVAMRQYDQRGAEKLRSHGSLVRAVPVFLKTNPFRQDLPQYSPSLVVELPRPTDDSREILHAAGHALQRIYRKGFYQKGGVMLLDLVDASRQQLSLLDTLQSDAERQRSAKLMGVMDELNAPGLAAVR
ncbi:DinB/UmuC family translesion DNA polymerase [Billgrantia diversa]|uniref:DinB/UmuC family translesion DNA polymerase n=1 Tax=Halomonas sp. MCCC 1A13316 TaxID=2733487 RepID=UPI002F965FA4